MEQFKNLGWLLKMMSVVNLESELEGLDYRVQVSESLSLKKRYKSLQIIQIDAMKLRAGYDANSEEEIKILERQKTYGCIMRKIYQEVNVEARRRSGYTCVVVFPDMFSLIVGDLEAMNAHYTIYMRSQ